MNAKFLMTASFPYKLLTRQEIIQRVNQLSKAQIPFLFIIDYRAERGYVIQEDEIDESFIRFDFNSSNKIEEKNKCQEIKWEVSPVSFGDYENKFDQVVNQIQLGNSFLVNLTQPSNINTNLNLLDLYNQSKAKYKLWLIDQFTVLSPESFVKISAGKISSFPMKGTIDASIQNAADIILNNLKEKAEHATIVDLIRNDLSLVANNVEVLRYRYIDQLHTNKGDLLQVSSEICGDLSENYLEQLGDIIFSLLPAGSICGAPKPKTLEIIENVENYDRGFYTGVFGYFDGESLDSAVMIRFVEQIDNGLVFKSGGGITSKSNVHSEYQELIQKVYVPIY